MKKTCFFILFLLIISFGRKGSCQEYKEIYVDETRTEDVEIHIYLTDFSLERAEIILDAYIESFKSYKKSGKNSVDRFEIVFWYTEFSKQFIRKVIKFEENPPSGTRSITASYSYSIDTKYIDKKIETF